jgi:hypothetical protein
MELDHSGWNDWLSMYFLFHSLWKRGMLKGTWVAGSSSDDFLCLLGGGQVPWVKQVHPRWYHGKNP